MSVTAIHSSASAPAGMDSQAARLCGEAVSTTIETRLEAVAGAWQQLEQHGIATPYQRMGWTTAWLETVGQALGAAPAIVMLRDGAGAPLALFPMVIRKEGIVRVARFAGGKHASFNLGLFSPDAAAALTADVISSAFSGLAGAPHHADVLVLQEQPMAWQGFANPLALLPHTPSANEGYRFALSPDWEKLAKAKFSHDARHKLRRKGRKLAEMGEVRYVRATTQDEARAILAAFFEQKAARFKAQGIPDAFADPGVREFLTSAATTGLETGTPAITMFACMLNERIIATYGAAINGTRFCGMFTSFDDAPDLYRWSPGDLLLMHIVEQMCVAGLTTFDLGVGDAPYKHVYCDEREALFDTVLPLTAKGKVAAMLEAAAIKAKRWVKQTPWMMAMVQRLRRLKATRA
jgi:CelD/BcsL family acetyltransferase involved in cellulose biosynthesis